jgi:hypothetical protein
LLIKGIFDRTKKGGNILLVIRTANFLKGLSVYWQTRNFEDLVEKIKGILKIFCFFHEL